jgi:iron complex transport system substrate-binding protein
LFALLVGLQLGPGTTAHSAPLRFASINLCTDQLLLELADREQVASVTFLSQHALSSYMADRAAGLHVNYGQAEELIAVNPDVVVTSSYDSPSTLRFLNDLGFRVEVFALADSIGEVIANIRQMAVLVGQEARGEELIGAIERRLHSILPSPPGQNAPRGVIYEPNGYTGGPETLRGDILRLSGWHNAAADTGITGVGVMGLEALLLAAPERLIFSPYAPGTHSLGQRMLQHPAVQAITAELPPLVVASNLWICGGSMNLEAIAQLVKGRSSP